MSNSVPAHLQAGARGIGLTLKDLPTAGATLETSLPFLVTEIRLWAAANLVAATIRINTENQDWAKGASIPIPMLQYRADMPSPAANVLYIIRLDTPIRWRPEASITLTPSVACTAFIVGYPDPNPNG